MAFVGIDLGTTNSLISVWKDGNLELIKNSLGHIMTPSVVGIDDDKTILVGEAARQRRVSHGSLTAAEFKRNMGTAKKYVLGDREFLPEELSALVLKKMIHDAEEQIGETVTEAVISVPAYFDDNQREATKRAANIAGIEVKRLINEPSAATLYAQWKSGNTGIEGVYVVVDFGGGTLDVSVVDCYENIVEILAVAGNNQLGGKDFDECIAKDFCKQNGLEFSELKKSVKENINRTAENVKKRLSVEDSVKMHINIENQEYSYTYDTNSFIKIASEILVKIKKVINEAIRGADVNMNEIVDVVMVGGSCKMPVVQKYISALFKRQINVLAECDLLVALGAGLLTGIIARDDEVKDIVMTDVCPFSLGVDSWNNEEREFLLMSVLIPKNSILPISKSREYYALEKNQKRIDFNIYQGEEMLAKNNLWIGEISVKVTPDEQGNSYAKITFTYDINGILQVTAEDMNGDNITEAIIVNKASGLTEEEMNKRKININKDLRFEKNKEENRNIIAWGQRLYAQANDEYKGQIAEILMDFQRSVENNDIIMVKKKKQNVIKSFKILETIVNRDCFSDDDVISGLLDEE